jgi:hypothetical protein
MYLPKVSLTYSKNNLLAVIAAIDGIAGMVGTVNTVALQGVPKKVVSLADAEAQGFTEALEPQFHKHLSEFYDQVGGEQELWIMGVAQAKSMTDMLDADDATQALKLIKAANGAIRLLGVFRTPAAGYDGGADFFDVDVENAITAAKTFCEARLEELIPLRVLVAGRIEDETSLVKLDMKTLDNGFAGVVLGDTVSGKNAAIGVALGRAVKYAAHIKLGKVANGPLKVKDIFIGTKKLSDVTDLDGLHGLSVISFMQHPNKAGFYFGIDRMASSDDFRLLAYGRVIDKAAVIAAAVYVEELESEVDVDADGRINETDIEHLKGRIEAQIKRLMADQISGASIYIDPKQDIINTGTLKVKVSVTPKGYTSSIEVELGLNAPSVA